MIDGTVSPGLLQIRIELKAAAHNRGKASQSLQFASTNLCSGGKQRISQPSVRRTKQVGRLLSGGMTLIEGTVISATNCGILITTVMAYNATLWTRERKTRTKRPPRYQIVTSFPQDVCIANLAIRPPQTGEATTSGTRR
jgi:hypothetical protein